MVWVKLQTSIYIFRLKSRIKGIYFRYLPWVFLSFSNSVLVYYLFFYSRPDIFLSCSLYSAVYISSGPYLFWGDIYWGYSHPHAGCYNLCFYSMLYYWFLCEACVSTSPLYLVVAISACGNFWKYTFAVLYCSGGGAHCGVVACSSASPPWVNDTKTLFVNFNKYQSFV